MGSTRPGALTSPMQPSPSTMPAAESAGGLLVVTVDRLPAWMLSAWGATWVSTPTFAALAAAGITFDRVVATGIDPRATLTEFAAGGRLWAVAAAAGWPAVIVTDEPALPEPPAGVDVVRVPAEPATTPAEDDGGTNLARLFAQAEKIVAAGKHRLVWCHVSSLGVAWDAPPAYRDGYVDPDDPPPPSAATVPHFAVTADTDPDDVMGCRQVFAGQLSLFDKCLAGLVERVRALLPAWAVAVAGVRGMPLGLHGEVGCGHDASDAGKPYGEWVHLPVILVAADGRMACQRFGGLVTPADIGATLTDLALPAVAAEGGPAQDARSLIGLFTDWSHVPRDRVIIAVGPHRAIATGGWHLVAERSSDGTQTVRLFAKPDDFFELADVADRCQAVAEELTAVLVQGAEPVPLSSAARGV